VTEACRLDRDREVHILTLCDGENRFTPAMIAEVNAALDAVETETGPAALVTTGEGKYFSNGLALEWMMRGPAENDPDRGARTIEAVYALLARFLTFPMPTVAAVNGHWFGAGALLGLAHDRRVARTDRGWFCMPEVTMGYGIAAPLVELLRATMPTAAFRSACATAARIPATEAHALGFVDEPAGEEDVVRRAVDWAHAHANANRVAVADTKAVMYAYPVAVLRGQAPGSRDHTPVSPGESTGA
jgi:enoyl-CoA hydratase/carnithine racemase